MTAAAFPRHRELPAEGLSALGLSVRPQRSRKINKLRRKQFFSEEKNQKTFITAAARTLWLWLISRVRSSRTGFSWWSIRFRWLSSPPAKTAISPVPIRALAGRLTADTIELSMSVLRGVSPGHLQYMRNMGVGALMTISRSFFS